VTVAVRFPDAEAVVASALAAVAAVPVRTVIPAPRPTSFVRLLRTGGVARTTVTDAPILTVEAWAQRPSQAAALAATTRAQLHALAGTVAGGVTIGRVTDVSGPQNLPDPVSDQARYTFAVEIYLRGTRFTPGS